MVLSRVSEPVASCTLADRITRAFILGLRFPHPSAAESDRLKFRTAATRLYNDKHAYHYRIAIQWAIKIIAHRNVESVNTLLLVIEDALTAHRVAFVRN